MFKLLMVFIIGMGVGAVLCAAVTVCILDRYLRKDKEEFSGLGLFEEET